MVSVPGRLRQDGKEYQGGDLTATGQPMQSRKGLANCEATIMPFTRGRWEVCDMTRWLWILPLIVCSAASAANPVPEREAAERGRKALETHSFNPPFWSEKAYETAWKFCEHGLTEQPANYSETLRERYGLHPAPYANDGLPMGLRKSTFLLSKGIRVDCLACHGGSIMGQSYIGLGNSTLDIQALFDEMDLASGRKTRTPFTFTNVRGTSEAGGMGVFLLGLRNP